MKDRVPKYPNRRLITPEGGGTPFHATVTRADDPIEEGTPLNAETLLSDATATKLGLAPEEATVNKALAQTMPPSNGVGYGTCTTEGNVALKVGTLPGFVKHKGAIVGLKFTYANTATSTLTLNVNETGAHQIRDARTNAAPVAGTLLANAVALFQFDGTYWVMLNAQVAMAPTIKQDIHVSPKELSSFVFQSACTNGTTALVASIKNNTVYILKSDAPAIADSWFEYETNITVLAGTNVKSMAASPTSFVLLLSTGHVYSSTDGVFWTHAGTYSTAEQVTFANSIFYLVTSTGYIYSSTSAGINWPQQHYAGGVSFSNIEYLATTDTWLATATSGNLIARKIGTGAWTTISFSGGSLSSISNHRSGWLVATSSRFLLMDLRANVAYFFYSTDGSTWSSGGTLSPVSSAQTTGRSLSIFGNAAVMFLSSSGSYRAAYTTNNGAGWVLGPGWGSSEPRGAFALGNTVFMFPDRSMTYYTTTTFAEWTSNTPTHTSSFTAPKTGYYIVECIGGGGSASSGFVGSAGSYAKTIVHLTAGSSTQITVGASGFLSLRTHGLASSFGPHVTALGGTGNLSAHNRPQTNRPKDGIIRLPGDSLSTVSGLTRGSTSFLGVPHSGSAVGASSSELQPGAGFGLGGVAGGDSYATQPTSGCVIITYVDY